ncbi:hypothetical protein A0H81_04835 [Grifola frondosa]|uniref:Uncharacterized protein n=1 Tax=Grifola frondosa TaxID=5627 RepID=A0A1C7MDY6_GRIFR|nr:hypothetical protein A0H81_04835 [Grifola frondosa]
MVAMLKDLYESKSGGTSTFSAKVDSGEAAHVEGARVEDGDGGGGEVCDEHDEMEAGEGYECAYREMGGGRAQQKMAGYAEEEGEKINE